jgi:hypothetical protein
LLVLTIVQPAIWVRVVLDVMLWIGVLWPPHPKRSPARLVKPRLKLSKA